MGPRYHDSPNSVYNFDTHAHSHLDEHSHSMPGMRPPDFGLVAGNEEYTEMGSGSSSDKEETKPISKFTKPFKEDKKKGVDFEYEIFADQPGKGGDRDTYEINGFNTDVGHTFTRLTKINSDASKVERIFGFYPKDSDDINPVRGKYTSPGKLLDDNGHGYEISEKHKVSASSFEDMLDYVDTHQKDEYHLNKYNCTDFSIQTGKSGGISIPDTKGRWPGGGGSNPGDLGEDLRERKKKKKKP